MMRPAAMTALDATVAAMQADRAAEPVASPTARACAASVLHLWPAPAIVGDYLLTAHPDLRAEAARAAWAVVSDLRTSGTQVHAARAAARAIDGATAARVVSAAAAAMGAYAADQVPGRGTASFEASRAAEAAFRAMWDHRVRPDTQQRIAA